MPVFGFATSISVPLAARDTGWKSRIGWNGTLTAWRDLAEGTAIAFEVVRAAFERSCADLARGKPTRDATWAGVCEALGRHIPREMLTRPFESTPLDRAMFAYANSLAR